ncbi:RNA polymerase sigma factor RpoE [Rubripirellula tenax]|uniref:RNA polymerase sigma factor RpoE n=1 Tax=Rubripirellula tenax TaxID=2528015 RepID=A0A5C6FEI9_9BACT|nr:sigma-70 family RNA polymerase sigma factor [Rubripirellula tenax]TWU60226.1 RNA polymerase sigma factor RpoE [Rubripirellula tenax]
MADTSLSLLQRIKHSDDSEIWNRLDILYRPLLVAWMRKYDVQPSDADDLAQEVLWVVSKEVGTFEHNGRTGAFRAWIKTILVHRLRTFWRTRDRHPRTADGSDVVRRLAELDDPASDMSRLWDDEHDRHVAGQLMIQAERHFSPETWNAFKRVAIDGARADVAARELGMTLNAVFIAKSRVLSRLRQEAAGLVEHATTAGPEKKS